MCVDCFRKWVKEAVKDRMLFVACLVCQGPLFRIRILNG